MKGLQLIQPTANTLIQQVRSIAKIDTQASVVLSLSAIATDLHTLTAGCRNHCAANADFPSGSNDVCGQLKVVYPCIRWSEGRFLVGRNAK